MTDPRPDPDGERAGETGYGNDSGFADAATGQDRPAGEDDPTTDPTTEEPAAPGEPPD